MCQAAVTVKDDIQSLPLSICPDLWFAEVMRGLLSPSGWEKFGKGSVEQGSDVWVFDLDGISVGQLLHL